MASKNPVKKFELASKLSYNTDLRGYEYEDQYCSIYASGLVTLRKGICSDGCSPTYNTPLGVIGVWNGPIQSDGLPITARAFFLHDALLERRRKIGIPVDDIHKAFEAEIMLSGFILAPLYAYAVNQYGPRD